MRGEFELIARYFAPLAEAAPGAQGLRNDAALFDPAADDSLVLTVDAMVAGVHFLPEDPPETIGRKLLRVNLSDLAAMGARPRGYLLAAADRGLLELLVRGVGRERDELDDMLAAVLDEDWPVERLETLLQILLRVAALELTRRPEAPVRVVVSEYVDLAVAFFGGKEPGLVNGVLDRLARALRPEAFEAPGTPPGAPRGTN